MSEEENATMRTEEDFRDYTAKKFREMNDAISALSHAFDMRITESSQVTERRLSNGDARMGRIEIGLQKNNDTTDEIKGNVQEVLDVVTALKGGKTVLGWAGKVFVWFGGIAGAWVAFSSMLHDKLPWQ